MFFLSLPITTKIGDTVDCRINAEPKKVTWRDAGTLVIEPGDARRIVDVRSDGKLNYFTCADADGADDFAIITEEDLK